MWEFTFDSLWLFNSGCAGEAEGLHDGNQVNFVQLRRDSGWTKPCETQLQNLWNFFFIFWISLRFFLAFFGFFWNILILYFPDFLDFVWIFLFFQFFGFCFWIYLRNLFRSFCHHRIYDNKIKQPRCVGWCVRWWLWRPLSIFEHLRLRLYRPVQQDLNIIIIPASAFTKPSFTAWWPWLTLSSHQGSKG